MKHNVTAAALAVAAIVWGGAEAGAAPRVPQPPADLAYFAEAESGVHHLREDDHGSEVTVISRRWLAVTFYSSSWPNGADGVGALWFGTSRGSRFFLSTCDEDQPALPLTDPVRVSRRAFFDRVASTAERSVTFTYDAGRNGGTFFACSAV